MKSVRTLLRGMAILFTLFALVSTGEAQRIAVRPVVQPPDPVWDSGKELFDRGDFVKAIEIWTNQLNSAPQGLQGGTTAERPFLLSIAYFRTGQYEKAVEWGKRALPIAEAAEKGLAGQRPTSQAQAVRLALTSKVPGNRVDCLQVIWRSYLKMNQFPLVLKLFREAIDKNPNDELLFRLLSQAALEAGHPEEALAPVKRAVELNAANPFNHIALGQAYHALRQYDLALKAFRAALTLNPGLVHVHALMGRVYLEGMDFQKAAAAFTRATPAPAGTGPESLSLNLCNYYLGRYDEVLASTGRLTGLGQAPSKAPGWLGVQSLNIDAATAKALQIGEIEGAVVISPVLNGPAEKAGIRRGDLIISLNGLRVRNVGELAERIRGVGRGGAIQVGLFRMGKPLELTVTAGTPPTLEEFMNLLSPEAGRATAFALRGLAERAKGNVDEGERLAEQALQSLKSFDLAILAAGLSKLDRGYPEAARKVLESMRTEVMSVAVLHGQVAQAAAWLKEGNVEKAREAYLRVDIPVKPEWKPLWDDRQAFLKAMRPRVLESIKNAVDFEKKGRLREALDAVAWASLFAADEKEAGEMRNALFALARKMKTPPVLSDEARNHFVRGKLLLKDGDLNGSLREFRFALALAPYSEELYFNTALICEKLKAYGEAIRHMRIFVQFSSDEKMAGTGKDRISEWELLLEKAARDQAASS